MPTVVAEPTRIVGTRVVTFDGLVTPTRLLIYNGVLTVSVWTIDARAVFPVFLTVLRVVTPGVALAVAVAPVERTVTLGRLATVFVAVARDVPARDTDARDAAVVAVRDAAFVFVTTVVGRADTVRAVVAFVTLRAATLRPVAFVCVTRTGHGGGNRGNRLFRFRISRVHVIVDNNVINEFRIRHFIRILRH